MAIINRVATGLLGLLDTKSQGRTPGEVEDVVRPTLEVTDMYAANIGLRIAEATQTLTVKGPGAAVFVPAGETWLVYVVSAVGLKITALGNMQVSAYMDDWPNQSNRLALAQSPYVFGVPINSQLSATSQWGRPLICPGGVQFGTEITELQNNGAIARTSVLYARL